MDVENPYNLKPGDKVICVDFSGSNTGAQLQRRFGAGHVHIIVDIMKTYDDKPLVVLDSRITAYITRFAPALSMREDENILDEIHQAQELYVNLEGR